MSRRNDFPFFKVEELCKILDAKLEVENENPEFRVLNLSPIFFSTLEKAPVHYLIFEKFFRLQKLCRYFTVTLSNNR